MKPGPKPGSRRRHGTRACYVMGCRRLECVKANRRYQRLYYRENYMTTTPDEIGAS